jgi:hypothetical protein
MRLATISIIVVTSMIYIGKIENGKVLATPVAPKVPTAAIKEGVELSIKILKTLKDAIEASSIMKKINGEIKKINLVVAYLTETERKMVTDAKVNLALAENEFTILRIGLTVLAERTKATTKRLIKFTKKLSDDNSPDFDQQFKVIFKRFITLMKTSSTKLKLAQHRYEKMSTILAETSGQLGAFRDRVAILDNEHSERYNTYVNDLRVDTYWTKGRYCLIVAITCVIAAPVLAAIVETKIKEYWSEVETMKENCKSVIKTVTGMLEQITAKDKELKEELKLVTEWEILVLDAKDFYASSTITETIQEIKVTKEWAIDEFQDLYNAADDFNKSLLT